MAKKTAFLLGILIILSTFVAACGPTTPAPTAVVLPTGQGNVTSEFKACFVYVGPIGDAGWTWAHDQGRLYLEETLGIKTAYIESVPEGADSERVIEDYAKQGCNIIFTTSFGYMDPTVAIAQKYPNVYFEHCSGYKTAANVATYFGRMEQPRYLSGMVAGAMTKSNKLGYVAAFPIPEVVRGINAFTLGARSVNPNAEVIVVWTNTWYDPVKERQAAEGLLDQGCDVIGQHQDTTEPQKAASERGMYGIGYDADMGKLVGDQVLTSPIWNWGPYYVETITAIQAGTWKTHEFYGGFKDGVVDLAPFSPLVPNEVKTQVEAKKQEMIAGTFDPFQGPINDQTGTLKVPEGKIMTDAEILAFDWFVEGVVGDIPK